MKVSLSSKAEKQLKEVTKLDQLAIAQKIRSIASSNNVLNEEKLKGYSSVYRIRVGNYRIVYKKSQNILYVVLIGHRKDIYKLVNRFFK